MELNFKNLNRLSGFFFLLKTRRKVHFLECSAISEISEDSLISDTSSRPTANLKKPNRIVENSDESTETSDSSSEEEEDKEKTPQPTGRDEMLAGLARLRQMAGVTKRKHNL